MVAWLLIQLTSNLWLPTYHLPLALPGLSQGVAQEVHFMPTSA